MITKELIQFLQKQEGKDIILILQGIIIANILIEYIQIKQEDKNLIIENKVDTNVSIGFNLSQLMKITIIQENEVLLEFDQLQKITIKIIDKTKKLFIQERIIAMNFSKSQQYFDIN